MTGAMAPRFIAAKVSDRAVISVGYLHQCLRGPQRASRMALANALGGLAAAVEKIKKHEQQYLQFFFCATSILLL